MLYMKKGSDVIQCGKNDLAVFGAQGWRQCEASEYKPTKVEKKAAKVEAKAEKKAVKAKAKADKKAK